MEPTTKVATRQPTGQAGLPKRALRLQRLLADPKAAARVTDADRLDAVEDLLTAGMLDTYVPILPMLFNHNGTPYVLDDHFVAEPWFARYLPQQLAIKAGRQIGKSVSLASRSLMLSIAIPHFSTLFVTPLYEQVRRFSTQYVRKFIDESPLKHCWMDSTTENSVLQRSFKNLSRMFFSFATLSADRIRGISTHYCCFDESVRGSTTRVTTRTGDVCIRDVRPGQEVLSFDRHGNLTWKKVLKNSYHGFRRCYRLTTGEGRHVELTSESHVATTAGWLRVSEIIETVARSRRGETTDGPLSGLEGDRPDPPGAGLGDPAGGRLDQSGGLLHRPARPEAGRVPLDEVHLLVRVRSRASFDVDEEQTRLRVSGFLDARGAGLQILAGGRVALLPQTRVLPGEATRGEPAVQTATLTPDELVSIEDTGMHDVFDIEVEDHHTFVANGLGLSNCQDFDPSHIPIIRETMSHSKWRLTMFTGTPKSLDNTLEYEWKRSSMAEWVIPCGACGKDNIPSLDHDLDRMIGPWHEDIGETRHGKKPAVVCASPKCGKPIDPRTGRWWHRHKDLRWDYAGYHVPQILLPIHYADPKRWAELLAKRNGAGNYTPAKFYNEVLGESYDVGSKLVTETDIRRACQLPFRNNPLHPSPEQTASLPRYVMRFMGVDWGGGGEEEVSFTTAAVVGLTGSGNLDVIYGQRLLQPHNANAEATELMRIYNHFQCQAFCHDYNGSGNLRELFMLHAGLNSGRIKPMRYCRTATQDIMFAHRPEHKHHRFFWNLDKARSLQLVCEMIKLQQLRFFQCDFVDVDNRGLLWDFLALVEHKTATARAGEVYNIHRMAAFPDDFAHAVNFACCGLWQESGRWPNVASLANLVLTAQQFNSFDPPNPWSGAMEADDYLFR